jgi:ribosomal protein L11 methyltransferase
MTANITSDAIIAHAEAIGEALKVGGILITSGITSERSLEVEQGLRNAGLDIRERLADGEWAALVAVRAG